MDPELAGMGLAFAGDAVSQVGQMQGAQALAAQQQQQLQQQLAFQQQKNQNMGAAIANNSPWAVNERYGIQMAQPGQQYLQNVNAATQAGGGAPMGLSFAGRPSAATQGFQQGAQQNQANLQAATARLMHQQGIARGRQQAAQGQQVADSQDKQVNAAAEQAQSLYGIQDQVAAGKGMALRNIGNMAMAIGAGGAGGGFGAMGGGSGGSSSSQQTYSL